MKIFFYSLREFDELNYLKKYAEEFKIDYAYTKEAPNLNNASLAKGYDGICIITTLINKELVDAFSSLNIKYIATRTVGFDHIDIEECKKKNIKVMNVNYPEETVANYSIMMMLMALRKVKPIIEDTKNHNFSLPGKIGKEISTCKVGVIGTGRIGEAVIKRIHALGCKDIICYDVFQKNSVKEIATYVPLEKIFKECDLITLHCPENKYTHHIINKESLNMMKKDVVICNTARGALINSKDLISFLELNKEAFASIDVYEEEIGYCYINFQNKEVDSSILDKLSSLDNVLITHHMAFYTDLSVSNMVKNAIEGLLKFDKNEENIFEIKYFKLNS